MKAIDTRDSADAYTLTLKVRDYEVDSEGIVNNAVYLNYFEHTRHEFCDQAGVPFRQMLSEGIVPVVREVTVRYLEPLRLSDVFDSCLRVRRSGPRFVFEQWIMRHEPGGGRTLAAEGQVTIVAIEDGRLSRGDRLAGMLEGHIS